MKKMLWLAILAGIAGLPAVSAAQDAGSVGEAAAFLVACPHVEAGTRLVLDAKMIKARGEEAEFAKRQAALSADLQTQPQEFACASAESRFGREGSQERSYLVSVAGRYPLALDELIAANTVILTGEDIDLAAGAGAQIAKAEDICPGFTFGVKFDDMLQSMGISVDEMTAHDGRLRPEFNRAVIEVEDWIRKTSVSLTQPVAELRFCDGVLRRFGPDGNVWAGLVRFG